MGWKGESRRHSLSRKGIKTAVAKGCGGRKAKGSKKLIPQGYWYMNRDDLLNQSHNGLYRTKSGKMIKDLSIGGRSLSSEEIMGLDTETVVNYVQVTGKRGRVSGTRLNLEYIIIPQTDPLLLQVDIGTKVEMEHTDNWREAQKIAIDHLEENDSYYFILLEAFPDEHPVLLKQLQTNLAHGIPKTKMVGSKRYRYHSAYLFRVWADTVKEHLEKRGFKVKETIANNGVIVLYKYGGN